MSESWTISKDPSEGLFPETIISPIDKAEMVFIPAGSFTMGITPEELLQIFLIDERQTPIFVTEIPARSVHLDAFYIDRYPVTNYQYGKFIDETGHREPLLWNDPHWNKPLQPVVFVGWDDARAYARWAGKSLPEEAQWEKAGRGTDGRFWTWGHEFFPEKCNSREIGIECTSEIDRFYDGISPYGCFDMCGNVWEMCEGRWQGEHLPMRGGCFLGSATFVRITCRWTPEDPVNGAHWLGFRCAKNIPTLKQPGSP
ncbi:formylglycine-generating enzyme family protein [Thermodesulfobacteriota bacterium]